MHPGVVLIVLVVVALLELPDKSMFATLLLASRYRPTWVFSGVAAAFLLHVAVAVAAGGVLGLLPHRAVEGIGAGLFAAGAAVLLTARDDAADREGEEEVARVRVPPGFRRVALTSFGVVFVGEWGDITQVATLNYAARYHDPLSVGLGAVLGLWAVTGLAVTVGQRLLRRLPMPLVRKASGLVLLGFAAVSAVAALR